MNKSLRKSYERLDLPYNSTIDEVQAREKALIKILKSKEIDNGVSCKKEISNVQKASALIIENIKTNGIPKEDFYKYEASNESLVALFIVLLFACMVCFFSFYLFI